MTYLRRIQNDTTQSSFTVDGRNKAVSGMKLFDGKIINRERDYNWSSGGTGIATFIDNYVDLAVTAGQYMVRQSRVFTPYFSGNPQEIEKTLANFQLETGLIKRFGYFSSSVVAPYTADIDGFYVESNGDASTYKLKIYNFGTLTYEKDITSLSHNWSNFTVAVFEFLWLGGAALKYSMIDANGLTQKEVYSYVGQANKTFIKYPSQPVRYEIRSTTGAGFLRTICSQVSTQGGQMEIAESFSLDRGASAVTGTSSIGTFYPVMSLRLNPANRHNAVYIKNISATNFNSTNLLVRLYLNPTIAGTDAVSWVSLAGSPIQYDISRSFTNTVSGGKVLFSDYIVSVTRDINFNDTLLQLSQSLTASDEIVLAIAQLSGGGISVTGGMTVVEV